MTGVKTEEYMPISKNALYRMDLTIALSNVEPFGIYGFGALERELKETLDLMCKAFVFQLEKGAKSDTKHFQCRVSLKKKCKTMVALDNIYDVLSGQSSWQYLKKTDIHISPTQSDTKDFDYVMKEDTRERPPVSSKPMDLLKPKDIIDETDFNPVQRFILNEWINKTDEWDPLGRRILFVTDVKGGAGKSELARTLCYKYPQLYAQLDGDQSMDRLVTSVIHAGPRKAYFIDLPRASENAALDLPAFMVAKHDERVLNILRFCEKLKNGNVTSSFYGKYQQLIMSKPVIIVFSNWSLCRTGLGPDRVVELDTSNFSRLNFWEKYKPHTEDSSYATLLNKVRGYKE